MENRKPKRHPLRVPVFFTWRGERRSLLRGKGMTRDVSASGVYVFSDAAPPVNAVLQIEIVLPRPSGNGDTRIRGKLVVLRIDGTAKLRKRTGFAGEASQLLFPAVAQG